MEDIFMKIEEYVNLIENELNKTPYEILKDLEKRDEIVLPPRLYKQIKSFNDYQENKQYNPLQYEYLQPKLMML